VSSMAPSMRDYPSFKEYADAQREIGSCAEDFKATMKTSFKWGSGIGVPFGVYCAYRMGHRRPTQFVAKAFAVTLTTTMAFGCMGLMTATYNCLRVKM
ncbi:hypothetical protein PFISCL1PPCAC_24205, partial [Pristionchus fissidentatus]